MSTQIIPLPATNGVGYRFQAAFDGVLYTCELSFNSRCKYWVLSLYDAAGEPIVSGVRCVANYSLLARCSFESRPPGKLLLVDSAGTKLDPDALSLGSRVKMAYITPVEA